MHPTDAHARADASNLAASPRFDPVVLPHVNDHARTVTQPHEEVRRGPLRYRIRVQAEPMPPRSNHSRKFGERRGKARGGRDVQSEVIVSAAQVLQESVCGDDHLRYPIRL